MPIGLMSLFLGMNKTSAETENYSRRKGFDASTIATVIDLSAS
jgi:hypothetical protein